MTFIDNLKDKTQSKPNYSSLQKKKKNTNKQKNL